jgi:hypothetical protein
MADLIERATGQRSACMLCMRSTVSRCDSGARSL